MAVACAGSGLSGRKFACPHIGETANANTATKARAGEETSQRIIAKVYRRMRRRRFPRRRRSRQLFRGRGVSSFGQDGKKDRLPRTGSRVPVLCRIDAEPLNDGEKSCNLYRNEINSTRSMNPPWPRSSGACTPRRNLRRGWTRSDGSRGGFGPFVLWRWSFFLSP